MILEQILAEVRTYDGVLVLAPSTGTDHPEISWGDYFFYYAPDGDVPGNRQPFATVVTKDYPDDAESHLNATGRWRLNIHVGSSALTDLVECEPYEIHKDAIDYTTPNVFNPHPLYGGYGWVCVVNPSGTSLDRAVEVLRKCLSRRSPARRASSDALSPPTDSVLFTERHGRI